MDQDALVRLAAFDWLKGQVAIHGDVLPWGLLLEGFVYRGQRVPLLSQQGIFKPALIPEIPLSIRTSHDGPYADMLTDEDLVLYKYRGDDAMHWQNVGLRRAMERGTPLIYFHGIVPGKYFACWPVYIVADRPAELTFTVAVDDAALMQRSAGAPPAPDTQIRRVYVTAMVRRRVHQRAFRERVLAAYRDQCAMCRLRHERLLDAAHILPDSDERGEPRIDNGLSLCKIHHAAFDQHILGVTPRYEVVVRRDVLDELDGPMLKHGLQELHGAHILLPRRAELRPNPELLQVRFDEFRKAS